MIGSTAQLWRWLWHRHAEDLAAAVVVESLARTARPARERIVLLLGADAAPGGTGTLTIEDGAGREIWRGAGLVHGPPGGYTLAVPAELLPDGSYRLSVRERGQPASYRMRVRRGR